MKWMNVTFQNVEIPRNQEMQPILKKLAQTQNLGMSNAQQNSFHANQENVFIGKFFSTSKLITIYIFDFFHPVNMFVMGTETVAMAMMKKTA